MTSYLEELKRAMVLLSDNDYYFIGQNMLFGGTSMFHTITHVPESRRRELPVFEEVQAGIATGMALQGLKIVSIYPRMDFLIIAMNQIITHLDKVEKMSDGMFKPKVIIRTAVGSTNPLLPGPQHANDYGEALKLMVTNIDIYVLKKTEDVYPAYQKALNSERSSIIIEYPDLYNQDLEETLIKSRESVIR